jgi:DNA replication protein DnaC
MNCLHPDLQFAADEVQFFCNRWMLGNQNESMLILIGEPGCGKTHLLRAVERFARGAQAMAHQKRSERSQDVRAKVPSVMYAYWPTIASDLAKGHDWPMQDATDADLLLWDDLGSESDPWKNISDRACQILSRRERKFTLITTNIGQQNWETRFDSRINDRLLRNSIIVDLSAVPSYATR